MKCCRHDRSTKLAYGTCYISSVFDVEGEGQGVRKMKDR